MKILFLAFICTVIHIPPLSLRYMPFSGLLNKKNKCKIFLIYGLCLALFFVMWIFLCNNNLINTNFYRNSIFVFSGLLSLVNIIVIRGKYREHLFITGTEYLLGQMLTIIVDFSMQFFDFKETVDYIVVHATLAFLLYCALYFVIKNLLVSTVTPFLTLDVGNYWNTIWLIPGSIHLATALAYSPNSSVITIFQVLAQGLLVTATVLMCKSIALDSARMKEKIEISELIGQQKAHYTALSDRVMEARKIRHDAKHHDDVISMFIKNGDKDGLFEYCKDITKNRSEDVDVIYSGNSVIDALIFRYKELSSKHSIDFKISGNFNDIDINDSDLSVLIGNALDNAVAGCLTIKDNRKISLSIRKDSGALTIFVVNSFDGNIKKKDGKILSHKRKEEPGIGLASMKSICEKYGGDMEVRHKENEFSVMFYNL